ncbi:hypothetical protein RRG08_049422 [Elysia crispata]|uniref:Uncharacterized protein n=1 Tax=Elysia crispata TaxID=231223 RepID=A0AAE0ZT04_9GAST|nr:hypothetical protein RRG08_049422 [Elysia crispata]
MLGIVQRIQITTVKENLDSVTFSDDNGIPTPPDLITPRAHCPGLHDQLYSVAHIELGEGHKRTLKSTNEWIAMVEVYGFQEHFEVNLMCRKSSVG